MEAFFMVSTIFHGAVHSLYGVACGLLGITMCCFFWGYNLVFKIRTLCEPLPMFHKDMDPQYGPH